MTYGGVGSNPTFVCDEDNRQENIFWLQDTLFHSKHRTLLTDFRTSYLQTSFHCIDISTDWRLA